MLGEPELALAACATGLAIDHAEEADLWRAVLAECPNDPEALHHLGE